MRALKAVVMLLLLGCGDERASHDHAHEESEGWAVTSWGEHYEIFAECDPLIAGRPATSHTHVTVLGDFSPLRSGRVSAVLRAADGAETVFTQDAPLRDGIFSVEIAPSSPGDYELVFRIDGPAGSEAVASGTVRVGVESEPGALLAGPPAPDSTSAAPVVTAEVASFLKEQQWRTAFRTAWVTRREVSSSVRAPATIRAAAGAEVLLAAPLDGVVSGDTRVFVGREVRRGDVLVSLAPRASSNLTIEELRAETSTARARLSRLEELLKLGAVSQTEVEAARVRLAALEPLLGAAEGSSSTVLDVRAPFDGRVAETLTVPGAAVSSGDPLVRLVRTPPVWIEAALAPRDVSRLQGAPAGVTLEAPGQEPVLIDGAALRRVSTAPEIERSTGTVTVIFETSRPLPFVLGAQVAANILLAEKQGGSVVPASAVVDDAGITVVYVQIDGESFERRPVRVLARQGGDVLLEGIRAGERLVVVGGGAIRRAALLSSGEVEGHVH